MSSEFRKYFSPDYGLMAERAARAVLAEQPLRYGVDGEFWGYEGGVWINVDQRPALVLHARIFRLLSERYRPHLEDTIRGALKALVEPMVVHPTQRYINMLNGMVQWDAEGGAPDRLPHHEMYGSSVQLPVRYNEDSQCPEFEKFINASIAPDDRGRVWEILGYLMMSGNPLQRMFLLTGVGGNGKGVLLRVIASLLGRGNVANVPLHAFITDKFAPARLFGKLANACGDIDTTYIEQTGLIKQLAGEDLIDGERKYGQPFQFEFWGKSIFSANGIPSSADPSPGWTRRWEVVDFPYRPEKPDTKLKARLNTDEELEGVAYRSILALRDLMARGTFAHGEAAAAVHRQFAQKSNKVLLWLSEDSYEDPTSWLERSMLVRRFRSWDAYCNPAGKGLGVHKFYEMLRGVEWLRESKRRGVWGFAGARFLKDIAYGQIIDGSPESDEETAPDEGGQFEIEQQTLL